MLAFVLLGVSCRRPPSLVWSGISFLHDDVDGPIFDSRINHEFEYGYLEPFSCRAGLHALIVVDENEFFTSGSFATD
jgi:hypothetical protein